MTIDKSLKIRRGMVRSRSVLTRAERIERLKAADRWKEGDDPTGLAKVRVYKISLKKKKKKKDEEGEGEAGAAAPPAGEVAKPAAAAGKSAAGKPAAGKPAAGKPAAGKAAGKS